MAEIIPFKKLKKKFGPTPPPKNPTNIYFALDFDERGRAFITICDQRLKPIDQWDYRAFSGSVRGILKALDRIRAKQVFSIEWDNADSVFYLAGHEFLLWQLRLCDKFILNTMDPIEFQKGTGSLALVISGNDTLKSRLMLEHRGQVYENLKFINENHVLVGTQLFEVHPLGDQFDDLNYFQATFPRTDLERLLALLFSVVEYIEVRFEDYTVAKGELKQATAALLIEKVDSDQALYLRVCLFVPGYPPEFFRDYDIDRIVNINEIERNITVHELDHGDLGTAFSEITRTLNRLKKSTEGAHEYFCDGDLFIIESDLAERLLQSELTQLIGRYALFGSEKLHSYKIATVAPKLKLRLDHGMDFLEGEAELDFGGQSIALFDALSQYRKSGFVILGDGTRGLINQSYVQKLERLFKKKGEKTRISFFDLPLVEDLIQEKIDAEPFHRAREVFLGFNSLAETTLALPKISGLMRPYQELGFRWLNYLHSHKLGGCLADDMGLGKTLQTIALLASIYPRQTKPSLIVMPRSLLFNWELECRKFAPQLVTHTYYGGGRNFDEAVKSHIIFTTYALVRNDIKAIEKHKLHYVILDESQNIKNVEAQISKAVMLLNAEHRLALSGTPVENNLGEIYSLFRFLNPAMFGNQSDFNRLYATPIHKDNDKDAMTELRQKIYPFILRRLKRDVLKELPAKVENVVYVDMSDEQRELYETRRAFYYQTVRLQIEAEGVARSRFSILQALGELRQLATIPELKSEGTITSPKREVLMEHLLDVIANGHKVLVYANFLGVLDHVSEDLDAAGIEYLVMSGATRDRQVLVERFQSDPRVRVFLMTLKTGGVGLNLTAADYVYIFDPWWNRAAETQAIDRSHRIGQQNTVFSYRLITKDTIEEKILRLQEMKSELFDLLIGSDSGQTLKSLSEADVEFILGGRS